MQAQSQIRPPQLRLFTFADAQLTGMVINGNGSQKYYVTIADSIARILTTRLGERVMRPNFGSNLYLLRDRTFNGEWRVLATRWIFEAIMRNEPRVRFKQLHFNADSFGRHRFYLELDAND